MSRRSREAVHPNPASASAGPLGWIFIAIFLGAFLVYWPALHGTFLWDDNGHVTRADLQSLDGLARIWFQIGATQQYYPLLHSAFWLEHQLWGEAPLGYHVVNVLLHATAACLFVVLLRRLAIPGAALAGAIFAFHPVAVESVAWISEQKNTLSAVLYLAAALAYLRFNDARSPRRYALATALFVLALLTKTVTASLPAALLVLFWWQRGRLQFRRDALPLLPWFALGAASGLVTAWFERTLIGANGAAFELDALQRVLLAARVPWFYLGKLLWPANLTFIYPRWTIDATVWWQWLFPLATLGLLTVLLLRARPTNSVSQPSTLHAQPPPSGSPLSALRSGLSSRSPLAAALFFGGTLFPVLGFFNVFPFVYSFVADHFQYLASLGVITLVSAGLASVAIRVSPFTARASAAVLLLTLGTLSWRQAHLYRDVFTLWETTIARNPACWMAYTNLGIAQADAGRLDEAISLHRQALALRPDNAETENNLGYALSQLGRHEEALPHFHRAIRLQPNYDRANNNLGIALMALGRSDEGLAAFAEAVRLNPRYAGAHLNLGLALARLGRTAEALSHFQRAAEIDPDNATAQLNWATALMLTERFIESVPHFERALQLDPDSPHAHFSYATALAGHGLHDKAVREFRATLELDPEFGPAHLQLARSLRQLGRADEAQHHFLRAQQLGAAPPAP